MAVNAAGKTLSSDDFEVFGKVKGKYVCKYLFGLIFSAFYQLRMISELYIFVLSFFYCNFVAFICLLCFCLSCIFSKGNQYIYLFYISSTVSFD